MNDTGNQIIRVYVLTYQIVRRRARERARALARSLTTINPLGENVLGLCFRA